MPDLPLVARGPHQGEIDMSKADRLPLTGSQQLITSPQYPGLTLNISGRGAKSWKIQGRIRKPDGKTSQVRLPLAEWGIESPELLAKYREWRSAMIEGRNPLEEAREAADAARRSTAPTLNSLIGEFIDWKGDALKPASRRTYTKTIRLYAPDWIDRRIDTLTVAEVAQRYKLVCDQKSVGTAQTWISAVRSILNYAVALEYLERNPCDGLKSLRAYRTPEPRSVIVAKDDLPRLWRYLDTEIAGGNLIWPAMMQWALLTGCRRGEIAGMRWSEIDRTRNAGPVWMLPAERDKSARGREIPLGPKLAEILDRQREVTEYANARAKRSEKAKDLIWFTSWDTVRPEKKEFQGWSHATGKVRDALGLEFTWHDLRRTAISYMALNGNIGEAMIKRIVGHTSRKDITFSVYTHFGTEDVRDALTAHEAWMLDVVGGSGAVAFKDALVNRKAAQWMHIEDHAVKAVLEEGVKNADSVAEHFWGKKWVAR